MRTLTPTRHQPARLAAVEVLLLQPRDRAGPVGSIVDQGPWPVLVVVLEDPAGIDPRAKPLFELLDSPHRNRILMVNSRYRWSVDPSGTVLTLAVRAREPEPFDVDIVMPARTALDIFALLPADVTFAITTKGRAEKVTGRVAIRDALREVVLLVNAAPTGVVRDGLQLSRFGRSGAPLTHA